MGVPEETIAPSDIQKESRRIIKNILLISFAFLLNFNSFNGLSRLQSSLHEEDGMGTITSSILYGALVFSCLLLPKIVINIFGHKWTMPLCFSAYILWMAANGYAVWATMIPTSILVGLAAAPLWTAQCSYFTILAGRYAKLNNEKEDVVITRYFGIFFCFFQFSGITASIISSTVLYPKAVNGSSLVVPEENLPFCGAKDCPNNVMNETLIEDPSETTVWTLVGVYIAIAFLAIVTVSLFVDNLPQHLLHDEKVKVRDSLNYVKATARQWRNKEQVLLIPLTVYSGLEQTAATAEFTNSYVTCSLGIWNVGFVFIAYGIMNSLVSFTSGRFVKYTGRIPIFTAAMVIDLSIQITLLTWMPHPNQRYVFYIIASLWGISDGIWQTQINALYGSIFSEESEAAFSNYRMWESTGFIIAFAYSAEICTSTKLYILISFLIIGMILYYIVEFLQNKKPRLTHPDPNIK